MVISDSSPERIVTPFAQRILDDPLLKHYQNLNIGEHSGTTDPEDHLSKFESAALLQQFPDGVKCQMFLTTLGGATQRSFKRLPENSIRHFKDFRLIRFSAGMSLMNTFAVIVTRRRVSLCFVTWNIAALMIIFLVSMIIHTGALVVDGEADDSHLEAHLKRLNKPAVKTMKTQHGDIFDCVPLYKQPAFDHPLLADHTIQMKPSFVPNNMDDDANHIGSDPLISTKPQLEIESCPVGTVPIRRTQISDLRRVAKLQNYGKRDESDHERQEQAGAKLERGGPYLGAKGLINVWDIEVNDGEWSHSAIEITDQKSDFIEAGLMVHPQLFGDQKSRFYTYWTANGHYSTGCYNLLCPGFIQVNRNITVGSVIFPTSSYNGSQYVLDTVIYRDLVEMNWWLQIHGEPVGYWPKELFGGRFEEAMEVKWIGSVLNSMSDGVSHTPTMMGSGRFPKEGFGKAAFFENVGVMNYLGHYERPMYPKFYQTNKGCYEVDPVVQNIYFYFGGPGGRYAGCTN
ncbi:uncharacterized protein LOC122027957 [Zingiber officinale]|uniref:uncharacterized protein LOC122027957 n=1 Tax=Zingiber officinale TaxID=94328 RepID=UPI001C4C60E0|nr:uncharacterized protein LOC122027957 [Zingiber officinale]